MIDLVAAQLNPRRLVTTVSIETLIEASVKSTHPFGVTCFEDGTVLFICPRCGYVDSNGGSAAIVDGFRWHCHRCRYTGTRCLLERLILEDADRMDALYRLIAEGAE